MLWVASGQVTSWNEVNAEVRMEKKRRKQRQRDVTVHRHSRSNPIKPCLKRNFLRMFSYIYLESPFSFEANLSRMSVRSNRNSHRICLCFAQLLVAAHSSFGWVASVFASLGMLFLNHVNSDLPQPPHQGYL